MSTPSWRQFAAIPFDATVAAVVRALAVEVPAEGRPRSFRGPDGFLVSITNDGAWIIHQGGIAQPIDGPDGALRIAKLPTGTPSGDALRQWLRLWGWLPKAERPVVEVADA